MQRADAYDHFSCFRTDRNRATCGACAHPSPLHRIRGMAACPRALIPHDAPSYGSLDAALRARNKRAERDRKRHLSVIIPIINPNNRQHRPVALSGNPHTGRIECASRRTPFTEGDKQPSSKRRLPPNRERSRGRARRPPARVYCAETSSLVRRPAPMIGIVTDAGRWAFW